MWSRSDCRNFISGEVAGDGSWKWWGEGVVEDVGGQAKKEAKKEEIELSG